MPARARVVMGWTIGGGWATRDGDGDGVAGLTAGLRVGTRGGLGDGEVIGDWFP